MRLTPSFCAAFAAALLLALPHAHAHAQQPAPKLTQQPASQPTQTLQVYSRETIVDVTVTDNDGHPVTGLKASDFTADEDGKPQTLRSFQEFGPDSASTRPKLPPLPQDTYNNLQVTPAPGPLNIILVDTLNTPANLVAVAQQQIVQYLRTMPPGTQVAIFRLSGVGLQVLQGFTSDRDLLLRAMDTNFLAFSSNTEGVRRRWITLDALDQIASYLTGIKGRKNLLWFVPGMPVHLTRDGGYGGQALPGNSIRNSTADIDLTLVHRLMDTYERFTAEQIAISPIDPRPISPSRNIRIALTNLYAQDVAQATGGVAYYNNNDLKSVLSRAIDDGSHYYTLSYFTPNHHNDGRYHKIRIHIDQPHLHLRYRQGYNAEDPPAHTPPTGRDLVRATLNSQAPPSPQVLFDLKVSLAPPTPPSEPSITATSGRRPLPMPGHDTLPYDVLYFVPQSQIAFTTQPDGIRKGSVEFDIIDFNTDNRPVASVGELLPIVLTPAEYPQFLRTPFKFYQRLNLPPGPAYLHVAVLDTVSGKVGSIDIHFTVPSKPPTPTLTSEEKPH